MCTQAAKDSAKRKKPSRRMAFLLDIIAGDHLISHTVARAVPSAQRGLTSVFGMGTGDPSQYGHRQIVRDAEILHLRSGFRLTAYALNTPQLMMALGGWLPAAFPRRLVCPGWFLPG